MENMDLIILTSIIATLFLVFFIAIYKEISTIDENSYKHAKEGGPRAELFNLMARLFDDKPAPKKKSKRRKKAMHKAINRTIADMESDGIYFSDDMKNQLKKHREEMHCEYSGLPSVKAYGKPE